MRGLLGVHRIIRQRRHIQGCSCFTILLTHQLVYRSCASVINGQSKISSIAKKKLSRKHHQSISLFFIMFVTVYLQDAKKHTVIPQEYVYELVEVNLFNKGINPHQTRRLFFPKKYSIYLKTAKYQIFWIFSQISIFQSQKFIHR